MIHFEERPYSGESFRPRPEIYLDESSQVLIVATPWGARSAATKVIAQMTAFLSLAREDQEATSPFQRLSCLSFHANCLRTATLIANEVLYREDNQKEYKVGVEVFAAIIDNNEFVWLQAGHPQILLARESLPLLPLGSNLDFSSDLGGSDQVLPPLPNQLLGLNSSINFNLNSFRAHPKDKIVLLSHSHPPGEFYALCGQEVTLEKTSHLLARYSPDLAFWLGILKINPLSPPPLEG